MYSFEDILERHDNGSKKWNLEYIEKRFKVKNLEEYYPLFIADMDFKLPKEIIEPLNEFIVQGDFGYFDIKESFYTSVKKWYKDRYLCDIDKKWIVPSIGALSSMNVIVKKLFNKGDNILIFTPVYGPFKDVIDNNDMKFVSYRLLIEDNSYNIDFNYLKESLDEQNIKGIIFCNPHNPSGRCWRKDELDKLVDICKERNITIISDEVHGDLVLGNNKFNSLSLYLKHYDKIIVISSPNKTFNIAGLNISTFLCSNDRVREALEKEFNSKKLHVNRIGCEALTICYENGDEWLDYLRKNIKENIDLVTSMLKVHGINLMIPEAGYLLWVKLDYVNDIDDFILKLAKDTGVLLETGSRFIKDNDGFLRINVATSKDILKKSIKRFVEFYKKYKSEKIGDINMKREIINTVNAPAAIGPYSHGNKIGNFVFTSGQLPINPKTKELITEIKAATRQSLENVKAILEEAGASMNNVVKATVFVKDLGQFSEVNEVYSEYFGENSPARSCVQVAKLPMDAVVEIEVIATV